MTITVESSSTTTPDPPPSILSRYDANGDGQIDGDEVLKAVSDYFKKVITSEEVLEAVALYFAAL